MRFSQKQGYRYTPIKSRDSPATDMNIQVNDKGSRVYFEAAYIREVLFKEIHFALLSTISLCLNTSKVNALVTCQELINFRYLSVLEP